MSDKRNNQLIKNMLILSVGQLLPKLFSLVTLPIITAYLSTSEYGVYDLVNTLVSLLIPIITLQIQQGAFRFLISSVSMDDKDRYITNSIIYIIVSSCICYPIVMLALYIMNVDITFSIFICAMLASESLYNLMGQMTRGLGENIHFSLSVGVYSLIYLILLCVFVIIFGMSFYGVMLSMTIGYLAAVAYMCHFARIIGHIKWRKADKSCIKALIMYSAPIVPSSISLWICNLSDRLIITAVLGTAANGIYSVACKIPNIYTTAYNIFNLSWTETATRSSEDKDYSAYYSNVFDRLFLFMSGALIFIIAITPIIFRILVNEDYDEAFYQIPILYLGVFFNSFVSFFGGIYIAMKKTRSIGVSSVIGAVLNLVINLLLISRIGIYAASISTVVSYFVIFLSRFIDMRKLVSLKVSATHILVSTLGIIATIILCYFRSIWSILISLLFACGYNFIFNRKILFDGIYMIVAKLKTTKRLKS